MKKILLLVILITLSIIRSEAQNSKVLLFKHYDKIVSIKEEELDDWFRSFTEKSSILSKNHKLTHSEYNYFKDRITTGNAYEEYLKVDNLRYFYLTPKFEDTYFANIGSEKYKLLLESGYIKDKKTLKTLMLIRGVMLGGVTDLIISESKNN